MLKLKLRLNEAPCAQMRKRVLDDTEAVCSSDCPNRSLSSSGRPNDQPPV